MLTGAPPFTGATVQAVLARHSVDTVAPIRTVRSSVPEAIERVVLRSLAKVPADRYESARQLADALARAAAGGEDAAAAPRRARLAAAGVVLLGLALGALWWRGQDRRVNPPVADADAPAHPRVAILSFANLSSDTGSAYLARGVSEEIASRLGDFPQLRVASRSSVERLERAGDDDLLAQARSLGFGNLVEGSVRRAGDRIRVAVRLVTAADGLRRWDRSYDRRLHRSPPAAGRDRARRGAGCRRAAGVELARSARRAGPEARGARPPAAGQLLSGAAQPSRARPRHRGLHRGHAAGLRLRTRLRQAGPGLQPPPRLGLVLRWAPARQLAGPGMGRRRAGGDPGFGPGRCLDGPGEPAQIQPSRHLRRRPGGDPAGGGPRARRMRRRITNTA